MSGPQWTPPSVPPQWTQAPAAPEWTIRPRPADPWTADPRLAGPATPDRPADRRAQRPADGSADPWASRPAADPWADRSAGAPWADRPVADPGAGRRTAEPWADRPVADPWAGRPVAGPWAGRPAATPGADRRAGAPAEPMVPAGATATPAAPTAAAGEPPRRGVRHPVRLALYALVLFGLLAGSAAWLVVDKSVRLTVDGEARTVSTYASTVAGVLDDAGLTVSNKDVLAPAAQTRISDGAEIVLRRGRLLRLTIDGKPREVWVTATTVQEALDQVGYRQSGLFVSATRSERLPLEGYALTVRTPKTVTVLADGRRQRVVTTAATVGEALDEAGVTVDGDDKVSQLATARVVTGMTVTVTRVSRKTTTVRTVLEYDTIEKQDAGAAVGSRKVTTEGVEGLQQVTYVETYVDGRLTSKKVAKVTVLKQPVDEVVVVGPEPPPSQPAECADFPTTGGLNWCGLARCESGLNPNAYNPAGPYYGLYQFDVGTWQANGGTGTPSGKSIAEQTRVAYNLYQARGASPWPTCGRYL